MSMMKPAGSAGEIGETVASAREYEAAQKIVSKLIAADVPARDIAIVGQGVRTVERVTGRLGYAAAARSGAINGVLIGLFLAAIFVLGNPAAPIQTFVGVLFVGVAVGMIMSLISYTIVRRRRDFASVTQLSADHYEVTVLPASLGKARQALGRPAAPAPQRPVVSDEPPRYGERLPQGSPLPQQPGPTPGAAPAAPTPDAEPPRYGERIAPPQPAVPAADAGAPAVGAPEATESTDGAAAPDSARTGADETDAAAAEGTGPGHAPAGPDDAQPDRPATP